MTCDQVEDLSLIIPVYRNEENIDSLICALINLNESLGNRLTVTFVIDGSPDESGVILVARRVTFPFSSRILFHSRNFGSFTAIRTGLEYAGGNYFAVMAADLQEPPELIKSMFTMLESDQADVVFGTRAARDDTFVRDLLSNAFWTLYRKLVMPDVPRGGVDIFACNTQVRDALLSIREPNSSLIAQLFWLGFRRAFLPYQRRKRVQGKSAWRFTLRVRYMLDSIFSFSDLPILLALWTGVICMLFSLAFAVVVFVAYFMGNIEVPGYATLAILTTLFGSIGLMMQGILGSYLWRTYENTKQRPLRLVSRIYGGIAPSTSAKFCVPSNDTADSGVLKSK